MLLEACDLSLNLSNKTKCYNPFYSEKFQNKIKNN